MRLWQKCNWWLFPDAKMRADGLRSVLANGQGVQLRSPGSDEPRSLRSHLQRSRQSSMLVCSTGQCPSQSFQQQPGPSKHRHSNGEQIDQPNDMRTQDLASGGWNRPATRVSSWTESFRQPHAASAVRHSERPASWLSSVLRSWILPWLGSRACSNGSRACR